eukprot:2258204-Pyramimonas_sp.AAC.1
MDLSGLARSITGADHEGGLGRIRPDPVQMLALRFARITHDPLMRARNLDSDHASLMELQLAR